MWKPERRQLLEGISKFIIQGNSPIVIVFGVRLTEIKKSKKVFVYESAIIFVEKVLRECMQPDVLFQDGDSVYVCVYKDALAENVLGLITRVQTIFEHDSILDDSDFIEPIFSVAGVYDVCCSSAEEAFRKAYCAFVYGRDQSPIEKIVVYSETEHRFLFDGRYSSGSFKSALQAGNITFFCMPIINSKNGKISSFEVLSRMTTGDENKIVLPGSYLGSMEPEILMLHDLHIIEKAVAFLARVQEKFPLMKMNVNFSPRYLRNGGQAFITGMSDAIVGAFSKTSSSLENVVLEIIEESPISEQGWLLLESLKARGVRIHLDDFGSQFASLKRLSQFEFDGLKIDRHFLVEARQRSEAVSIFTFLSQCGKNLGIPVTVEGVEYPDDLMRVFSHECEFVQGYLFGMPLSPDDFFSYLVACGGEIDLQSLVNLDTLSYDSLQSVDS